LVGGHSEALTTHRWPRPFTIESWAADPFARPRARDGSR
jgi:hypothetical protein